MTLEEKTQKIHSINKMIADLKSNPSVEGKKTIQQLQPHLYDLTF